MRRLTLEFYDYWNSTESTEKPVFKIGPTAMKYRQSANENQEYSK